MTFARAIMMAAAAAAALPASAAVFAQPAGVPEGIAAWQAGDYERAVAVWRPLADAGNADAQFNLGQAYRLGRGVAPNPNLAEQWFERAARQRHEQAGTNLGLLLFQNGRAREAMPWIQAAAMRGDPRAQYVFGTALFNGDILRRDLPRAYAMMTLAAQQNFPQAADQLREMEGLIAAEDRARGLQIAQELGAAAPAGPPQRMAEVEPDQPPPVTPATPERQPGAGVSWQPQPQPRYVEPERPTPQTERPVRQAERPDRRQPARAAVSGRWRVQLGAFSNAANARRQWDALRRRVAGLGALQPAFVQAGAITRLRTSIVGDRADAARVCGSVRAAGGDCIPVAP